MRLFAIVALVALVIGCQPPNPVALVMAQEQAAHAQNMRPATGRGRAGGEQLDDTKYLAAIAAIDVSSCPQDFQTAWNAYIDALKTDGPRFFSGLLKAAGTKNPALALSGLPQSGQRWHDVQRIASNHGFGSAPNAK